jgi:hypothetical protein
VRRAEERSGNWVNRQTGYGIVSPGRIIQRTDIAQNCTSGRVEDVEIAVVAAGRCVQRAGMGVRGNAQYGNSA